MVGEPAGDLDIAGYIARDINGGFSGREMKPGELLRLLLQEVEGRDARS